MKLFKKSLPNSNLLNAIMLSSAISSSEGIRILVSLASAEKLIETGIDRIRIVNKKLVLKKAPITPAATSAINENTITGSIHLWRSMVVTTIVTIIINNNEIFFSVSFSSITKLLYGVCFILWKRPVPFQ